MTNLKIFLSKKISKVVLKQEHLTSRYAWLKIPMKTFSKFLRRIFPKPIKDRWSDSEVKDDFGAVRISTISLISTLLFG